LSTPFLEYGPWYEQPIRTRAEESDEIVHGFLVPLIALIVHADEKSSVGANRPHASSRSPLLSAETWANPFQGDTFLFPNTNLPLLSN